MLCFLVGGRERREPGPLDPVDPLASGLESLKASKPQSLVRLVRLDPRTRPFGLRYPTWYRMTMVPQEYTKPQGTFWEPVPTGLP